MNPAMLLQLIQLIAQALPEVIPLIEKIGTQIEGLDVPKLVQSLKEPNVQAVDDSIDAEINTRWAGKP